MRDESYRIDLSAVPPDWFEGNLDSNKSRYRASLRMTIGGAIDAGVLVPDTTKQAIADAWNNPKMATGEHAIPLVAIGLRGAVRRAIPYLADAIEDALTEENK